MLATEKVFINRGENNMETTNINPPQQYLSDYAVLIKKMRLLRKLTRQQASLLFEQQACKGSRVTARFGGGMGTPNSPFVMCTPE